MRPVKGATKGTRAPASRSDAAQRTGAKPVPRTPVRKPNPVYRSKPAPSKPVVRKVSRPTRVRRPRENGVPEGKVKPGVVLKVPLTHLLHLRWDLIDHYLKTHDNGLTAAGNHDLPMDPMYHHSYRPRPTPEQRVQELEFQGVYKAPKARQRLQNRLGRHLYYS